MKNTTYTYNLKNIFRNMLSVNATSKRIRDISGLLRLHARRSTYRTGASGQRSPTLPSKPWGFVKSRRPQSHHKGPTQIHQQYLVTLFPRCFVAAFRSNNGTATGGVQYGIRRRYNPGHGYRNRWESTNLGFRTKNCEYCSERIRLWEEN